MGLVCGNILQTKPPRGDTFDVMARIALNGRLLVPGKMEGIGIFTLHCLKELVDLRPNDTFLLLVDRPDDALFHWGDRVEVRRIWVPGRRPWLLRLWFDAAVPWVLRQWRADAFVSLEGPISLGMPREFPQLSVIHDLNFEHRPEWLPRTWARYYRGMFPRFAQKAHVLCTVSEASKQDIVHRYGVEAGSIHVIPNAASSEFVPMNTQERRASQEALSEGRPYFVFVGSLHPRKNLEGLLEAFGMYCARGGAWDLVVVGVAMWPQSEHHSSINGLRDADIDSRVHWVGRLNDGALAQAVGGAEALVFVPWFEGFGIPVVEAMASGTPVICSNTSALPEVCGGAAFALVPPGDASRIAEAMLALSEEPERRARCVQAGLERAGMFSWAQSGVKLNTAVNTLLTAPQTCHG